MLSVVILNMVMPRVAAPLFGPIVIFEEKIFMTFVQSANDLVESISAKQVGTFAKGCYENPFWGRHYKPFYGHDQFCIVIS
jgi:hypothetical protein